MNPFLKLAAVALVGTVAMAAPSSAITIPGVCGSLSGATELVGSFNCTQFDSNLGPLLSITLAITGELNGSITLTNNSGATANISATTTSSFFAGPLPGFALSNPVFSASYGTGFVAINTGQTIPFLNLFGAGGSGAMINNSNFAPYQAPGGGNFAINVSTISGLTVQGASGNIVIDQITNAEVTASVVYEYGVATPEPASMALLGAGMLALGFARRRRG